MSVVRPRENVSAVSLHRHGDAALLEGRDDVGSLPDLLTTRHVTVLLLDTDSLSPFLCLSQCGNSLNQGHTHCRTLDIHIISVVEAASTKPNYGRNDVKL